MKDNNNNIRRVKVWYSEIDTPIIFDVLCEEGEDSYKKNYLDNSCNYTEGNAKYYRQGMLMCMLLDKLDPYWKDSYGFDIPLSMLIEQYMQAE